MAKYIMIRPTLAFLSRSDYFLNCSLLFALFYFLRINKNTAYMLIAQTLKLFCFEQAKQLILTGVYKSDKKIDKHFYAYIANQF